MIYPEIADAMKMTVPDNVVNRILHLFNMQTNTVCQWMIDTFGDLSTANRVLTEAQHADLLTKVYEVKTEWTALNPVYAEVLEHTMYDIDNQIQPQFGLPDSLDEKQLQFIVRYLEQATGRPMEQKGVTSLQ